MFISNPRFKTAITIIILILAGIVTLAVSVLNPTAMRIVGPITGLLVILMTGGFAFWLFGPYRRLLEAIEQLSQNQWDALRQVAQNPDEFGQAARGILNLAEIYEEKAYWYQSILDAIPFPLSVTDMQMNWTFINRPVEQFLQVKREDVLGRQCENWNANICCTQDCGIARLRNNYNQTLFHQSGADFQVDVSYLKNSRGERIGHIEVVQDISRYVAVSNYQTTAVDQIRQYLEALSQGVLSFEILSLPDANSHTREVRENFVLILDHLEKARQMLYQTLSQIAHNADQVNSASNQLAAAAAQAKQATSQIAITIQEIAKGTSQQNESVSKMASMLDGVSQTVNTVEVGVRNQSQAVEQASKISATISGTDGINHRVGLSAQKVQEMGERSNQIGLIVETIEDIASQTNLLALNAAIEAARAGEHGKGFSVVADEVRKLAERSSAATKEISLLIKGIRSSVDEAVSISTSTATDIQTAAHSLNEAIQSVSSVVKENALAADQLTKSSSGVMYSIENVVSVSEENGAAVEEVSASAEEMSAQVEEVTASAQSLAEMAQALQKVVAQFKLSTETQSTQSNITKPKGTRQILSTQTLPSSLKYSNGHRQTTSLSEQGQTSPAGLNSALIEDRTG